MIFVLMLALAMFASKPVAATSLGTVPPSALTIDPVEFCDGHVGWPMDLRQLEEEDWPVDPQCGLGKFVVVVNDEQTGPFTPFLTALRNLASRGGFGSVWFQPAALPKSFAPNGFCNGGIGWGINLANVVPQDPGCTNGEIAVVVGEMIETTGVFTNAVTNLNNRGGEGAFWFQPVQPSPPDPQPVTAPAGFCNGNDGWSVNLTTDIPQEPSCGFGVYKVDVSGVLSDPVQNLQDAVTNLSNRGQIGTFWFVTELITVSPPEGFCQGNGIAWVIDLFHQAPVDPNCIEGNYEAEANTEQSGLLGTSFGSAIEFIRERGMIGTAFFTPNPPPVPQPTTAPASFCAGTEGWSINLLTDIPQEPSCEAGKFVVVVNDILSDPMENLQVAVEHLTAHGGQGSFWFQPAPVQPTSSLIFLPLIYDYREKVIVVAPSNFCGGTEDWFLNLANESPSNPNCSGGDYTVEVTGEQQAGLTSFELALENLTSRGEAGTLWFVKR